MIVTRVEAMRDHVLAFRDRRIVWRLSGFAQPRFDCLCITSHGVKLIDWLR